MEGNKSDSKIDGDGDGILGHNKTNHNHDHEGETTGGGSNIHMMEVEVDYNQIEDGLLLPSYKIINGLTFSSYPHRHQVYVPPEILTIILSYCDDSSLLKISKICKLWYDLFHNEYFWNCVLIQRKLYKYWKPIYYHIKNHPDSWQVFYSMVKYHFLNQNLVKNSTGIQGFGSWTLMSGESGGWRVETEIDYLPFVESPLPLSTIHESRSCFSTNQFSCSKEQIIDLWAFGFTPPVMRACVPFIIKWSEYVTTPFGHNGIYEGKVSFLDTDLGQISPYSPYEYKIRETLVGGTPWKKFSRNFIVTTKNAHEVIDDLRYFYIYHGGMEIGSTEGHFGPKITYTRLNISLLLNHNHGITK